MSIYPNDPDKQRMVHIAWISLILALACMAVVFGWTGCADSREPANPAPSSSITIEVATVDAYAWALRSPGKRSVSVVKATGSMLPVFGSNSVLLVQPATGFDLTPGDIAIYDTPAGQGIVHRVREVNERGAVLFTGDNNANTASDGWIASERIRGRVAGILFARRQ